MRLPVAFAAVVCLCAPALAAADDAPPTVEQRMANSKSIVDTIRGHLGQVMQSLENARQARDVAKLNFINEKTIALKGLMRIAEQADINLQEALLKHDEAAAAHEEEKLNIALQKAAQLAAEAASYVGDVEIYTGDTSVEVTISEDTQKAVAVNPTTLFPPIMMSSRPPAASPYE